MKFPPDFQFNQGNLQNFLECRRRFYFQSIRRLVWPAIVSEPMLENERQMHQGDAFHRLAQQSFMNIPPDKLRAQTGDDALRTWLEQFLTARQHLPGINENNAACLPEYSLTIQLEGFRIAAKFDLLVTLPDGRSFVYDWKTSRNKTRRLHLSERVQTRLYPMLLVEASRQGNKQRIEPERVQMIYWYANFPDQLETFPYSEAQYNRDSEYIHELIQMIRKLVAEDASEQPGEGFPLTNDEKRCAYCVYRSLCNRGTRAGSSKDYFDDRDGETDDPVDLSEIDFTLEQITEIEF